MLRLLNETAATALAWGLPKTMDLPDDSATPRHVLFFDMGHSNTQVSIVAFTKGKMTVLAAAFDRNLGGRDIDLKILNYFAAQWKEKKKLNLHESPKAVLRLLAVIDKATHNALSLTHTQEHTPETSRHVLQTKFSGVGVIARLFNSNIYTLLYVLLTCRFVQVKQQLSGYTSSAKLPVNVECLQDGMKPSLFVFHQKFSCFYLSAKSYANAGVNV